MNKEKQDLIDDLARKMAVNDLMYDYRIRAITEFAEKLENLFAIPVVPTRYFHFDCWKRDGKLKSKRILATCEEHATLLFEKQYPDYAFDPPY